MRGSFYQEHPSAERLQVRRRELAQVRERCITRGRGNGRYAGFARNHALGVTLAGELGRWATYT